MAAAQQLVDPFAARRTGHRRVRRALRHGCVDGEAPAIPAICVIAGMAGVGKTGLAGHAPEETAHIAQRCARAHRR